MEQDTHMVCSANVSGHELLPFQEPSCSNDARHGQPMSYSSLLRHAVKSEFTISANADTIILAKASEIEDPGAWSNILQGMASLFGILQVIFGTVVFSSLLYIGVGDATILLLRYAASALSCRLIMYLELEGMVLIAGNEGKESCSDGN